VPGVSAFSIAASWASPILLHRNASACIDNTRPRRVFEWHKMNSKLVFLPILAMGFAICISLALWMIGYVKVGPNQVLIVSGRRRQLPDGTHVGFRLVKGGGTFVFPLLEKAQVLSLEVICIEAPKLKVRTANGEPVEADCVAQVKIKGDDASIVAAAEHFLGKSERDMENLVRPMLEKHLRAVLGNSSFEEMNQAPGTCADRLQTAAATDLGSMGLSVISCAIQNVQAK